MSQSLSRRSFLKCAGSGAVSLAAALLTGVSAAAAQPRVMGQPALLDGKAAVELLGYAPAPGLGGVLVYLSVENLSARTLPVGASYLHSRDVSTLKELYSLDSGVTARSGGESVPCGSFAAPLYAENAADASAFTLNLAAGRGAMLHCFCAVPEDWEALELSYRPAFAAGQPVEFVVRRDADAVRLGAVPAAPAADLTAALTSAIWGTSSAASSAGDLAAAAARIPTRPSGARVSVCPWPSALRRPPSAARRRLV